MAERLTVADYARYYSALHFPALLGSSGDFYGLPAGIAPVAPAVCFQIKWPTARGDPI